MKKLYAFLICILISAAQAQLLVSEKIYQQMAAREDRPALMKSNSLGSSESYLYSIAGKREFKSGKNFRVEKQEGSQRITPNLKKKNRRRRVKWSDDEMRSQAIADIKSYLPRDVADSCSITSVGYDYEQRDDNEPRIVGSTVMAHRILDGSPVRGSSYVMMSYDSTGTVSYMDVDWDLYNKVVAKSTIGAAQRNENLREDFSELVESISDKFEEQNVRGRLDNAVETLSALKNEEGVTILVPTLTFIGQYSEGDDGHDMPMTFDIPTDASLVAENEALVSR